MKGSVGIGYEGEVAKAYAFLNIHNNDEQLRGLMNTLRFYKMLHSDRWSLLYDFLAKHYPDDLDLVTGLTYVAEGAQEAGMVNQI